ncbi:TPA: hypothetical protein ACHY6V_005631, partial [Escherichia coli]
MSAEFILSFPDDSWYLRNRNNIVNKILFLSTYRKNDGDMYYLSCDEGEWDYCVRLCIENCSVFIEIFSHPASIEKDLISLFTWIRSQTIISICDNDGEESG